jgi:hypothetical protein
MDMVSRNYVEYLSDIDVAMGGKAAEELIFGPDKVTSGISAVSNSLLFYFSCLITDKYVNRTFNQPQRQLSHLSLNSVIPRS